MLSRDIRNNLDEIVDSIAAYIERTYGEHYSNEDNGVQLIDLWASDHSLPIMAKNDIMKYANRLGKKDGYNPKDVMKIIHYAIMLLQYMKNEARKETGIQTHDD